MQSPHVSVFCIDFIGNYIILCIYGCAQGYMACV